MALLSPDIINAIPPMESPLTVLMTELGPEQMTAFVEGLSNLEAMLLKYEWDFYARAAQRPPLDDDWDTWIIMAGRGFGKTRPGAEQVIEWSKQLGQDYGGGHIALIATNPLDARAVMLEGESGILACSPPWYRPLYEPSKKQLRWDNDVIAHIYSAEEPDQLRGPQHHKLWGDEPCKWKYPQETWDMAQFGLRLGIDPQALLTTTPRPIKMLLDLIADTERVRVTHGHTLENQHNLSPKFLRTIMRKYAGTRLGKQELEAKLLTDTPGALWKQDNLDETRVRLIPEMSLIIIAIDPQANDPDQLRKNPELLEETAETGIVVAGRGMDGHFYVLEDASGHYTPKQWGHKAVELYDLYKAEKIIGEVNNGGAMVKYTVAVASKALGQEVFFKEVHASRGKRTRAEPVAALYEQHRAHHVGAFSDLESQMITWVPGLKSPDRMDAMVWAATESMLLAPDDLIFQ